MSLNLVQGLEVAIQDRSAGPWILGVAHFAGLQMDEKAPDFLASRENPAIYRGISHGNMAQKAVRWQPGHKARLLTRFRRNQPENLNNGTTRFFYAPAA